MILCDDMTHAILIFSFGLTSLLFFISIIPFSHTVYATSQSAGIIIPLYTHPGSEWQKVIHAKNIHPSVPIIVIINPSNGPDLCPNKNYLLGITHLKSAGIITMGYVYTQYAARNDSEVITDIDNWKKCYPNVDGIFFDEMAYMPGKENYYANLTSYAKSKGFAFTVGNPGIDTLSSYIGTVDNIMIYEKSGLPNTMSLEGWHKNYDRKNFSMISYGVNGINNSTISRISHHVGYFFVTNGTLPNPFTSLPPFFDHIVKVLDGYNH